MLQIWAPSNWRIRIPFSGQDRQITHEDIIKNDPTWRRPMTLPIIDYDVTTSEELNEEDNEDIEEIVGNIVEEENSKKIAGKMTCTMKKKG